MRCDAKNRQIYNFELYLWKPEENTNKGKLKTIVIVTDSCDSLIKDAANPPSEHHIHVDRYTTAQQPRRISIRKNVCNGHCHVHILQETIKKAKWKDGEKMTWL